MPTYEFRCERCQVTFEVIASMDDYERMKKARTVRCSACGSADIVPQIVHFEVQTSRKSA